MKRQEVDSFLKGYLDAALFTTDADLPWGSDYVDCGRADEMFPALPDWFIEEAKKACSEFETKAGSLLEQVGDDWRNGSDFWYTRNRHGVGFWDRGYPDEIADPLSDMARKFGGHDLMPEDIGQGKITKRKLKFSVKTPIV